MWMRISLKMTDRRHMLMKQEAEWAVVGGYFHVTPTCCAPKGTQMSSSAESSTGKCQLGCKAFPYYKALTHYLGRRYARLLDGR